MKKLFITFIFFGLTFDALAQSRVSAIDSPVDSRGPAELVVCSQNLNNYGDFQLMAGRIRGFTSEDLRSKETDILRRIVLNNCDVIAVQEVLGKDKVAVEKALQRLAKGLRKLTNRNFEVRTGTSNDRTSHLGYLVATDRAEILNVISYARVELPRLTDKQKIREFARGPLEIQLRVKARNGSFAKNVVLVNFHFKSKRGKIGDPAGLEYETYRMEMAEALRRVVVTRHAETFKTGETVLMVLGDRNSNFDVASARILEGKLSLEHFKEDGVCRMSSRGVPLCQPGNARAQVLFSPFTSDPRMLRLGGTYIYKGTHSWLDDILLPAPSLRFLQKRAGTEGSYDVSIVDKYKQASDHAMVIATLNW